MPKIIFTSRYLRDAPTAQLENYVRYISTREGVEKIDESKRNLPATRNQQQLIQQLIRDIPASKDMLEYADFLLRPTIGNASEFISCALEQNLDLIAKRENYVDYIANRPVWREWESMGCSRTQESQWFFPEYSRKSQLTREWSGLMWYPCGEKMRQGSVMTVRNNGWRCCVPNGLCCAGT